MGKKEHLPLYGVGPFYAIVVVGSTVLAVLARNLSVFSSGELSGNLRTFLKIAGVIFIIGGIALWLYAVVISKIDDNIVKNRLVTTGAYALVRNPIYSAFMIVCTGVLLLTGNIYFFIFPFLYWIFMTILMKNTEEKWLKTLYGKDYEEYCRRVNRCWPWIPGKGV